jgi:hypothetical protein
MNRSYSKKRHINLVNEALERAYLEKKSNKKMITEADWGAVGADAAGGAMLGTAIAPGIGTAIGAVVGAAWGYFSNSGGSYDGVSAMFNACNTSGVGEPSMADSELSARASNIRAAIDGWGTDEDKIKANLGKLKYLTDFCRLAEIYAENYPGSTLLGDLDGDIDSDSQWNEYVYLPLLQAKRNTEKANKEAEAKKASDDKYKTFAEAIANLGTFAGTTWKKERAASDGFVYAGNMVIREKKISYLSDGVWQSANVESGSWSDPSTVKLEGGMSAEDFINKHKNWGTKKDTEDSGGGGKPRPRTTWEECSGTYHKGCKSSNGVIAKVQGCLGISTDGKFGSGTQSAVKTKIGTTTFTDADVDKLCKKEGETSIGGGGTPESEETPKPVTFKQL